jgi:hypothetical protein
MMMSVEQSVEWAGRGNWSTRRKPATGATLSTTNPTRPDLASNPSRRGGKPATNRLIYVTALLPYSLFHWLSCSSAKNFGLNLNRDTDFSWQFFSSTSSPPTSRRQLDHRRFLSIRLSPHHTMLSSLSYRPRPYVKHNCKNKWNSATNKILDTIVCFSATPFHNVPHHSKFFLVRTGKV